MTSPDRPLLRLDGLRKVFPSDDVETHALADVHLDVHAGDYLAIAGPSGCGKSSNLDSANGEAVMELSGELHRDGTTICMVTHDDRFAAHGARTVHLFDGRVVEERLAERTAAPVLPSWS